MYRFKQLILAGGDLVTLNAGLYVALLLRYQREPSEIFFRLLPDFLVLFGLAVVILFIVGLFDLGRAKNNWVTFQKIIAAGIMWLVLGAVYFYVKPGAVDTPKTILLLNTLIGFGILALWRWFHNKYLTNVLGATSVVFVGLTPEVAELVQTLDSEPHRGLRVVGIIAQHAAPQPFRVSCPVFSSFDALNTAHPTLNIQRVIVSPELFKDQTIQTELYRNLFRQTEIVDLAKFYEEIMGRIPPFTFSETWFVTNLREQQKKTYDRLRILLDYVIALVMLVFFAITFPIIALAIKITSPGPIFFRQKRIGRSGVPFTIIKYRTMKSLAKDGSAELSGPRFAAVNDDRITPVGTFLRKTRLDEIPQCLNILHGDMGVIGPRPERPEFVATLTAEMPFYTLRHLIKPGLTGWAQIQRSYYGDIKENLYKLEYDLFYIKNRGPLLDLGILLRTINTVARFSGR